MTKIMLLLDDIQLTIEEGDIFRQVDCMDIRR